MRSHGVRRFMLLATSIGAAAGCNDDGAVGATASPEVEVTESSDAGGDTFQAASDSSVFVHDALDEQPLEHEVSAHDTSSHDAGDVSTVGRYEVLELTFDHASAGLANPWEAVDVTVTFTTPTRTFQVGGFFYAANTWKARVAPDELGDWSWSAVLNDGGVTTTEAGAFRVTDVGNAGFVAKNPSDAFSFVTSDGAPYIPLGLGDCINDGDGDGDPFDWFGFDGDTVNNCADTNSCDTAATRTNLDTYLEAYGQAGFNFFRWSVDNCAFKLWDTIAPEGNRYLEREMKWGDTLVRKLRAGGFRVMMTIFGFQPPFAGGGHDGGAATPEQLAAVERYARYVVDRYGAYVDFWEVMNEASAPGAYLNAVAAALRARDPYRHLISTSWERPELAAIDIDAPHWYETENELESDARMATKATDERARGKVVIFGEQGNWGSAEKPAGPWDPRSGTRMRIRAWVALMKEVTLVFWNQSCCPLVKINGAANLYIGPEERGFTAVLRGFADTLTASAQAAANVVASNGLRAYGLADGARAWLYVVSGTNHSTATTGGTVAFDAQAAGTATFVAPTTGEIVGTQSISAGRATLMLPSFTTDLAVRIAP